MGKGDKRSRRGKIWRASYGKARPHTTDGKQPEAKTTAKK